MLPGPKYNLSLQEKFGKQCMTLMLDVIDYYVHFSFILRCFPTHIFWLSPCANFIHIFSSYIYPCS